MLRRLRFPFALFAVLLAALTSQGQKLETVEMTSPDDLFVGPKMLTLYMKADANSEAKPKEVNVHFVRKNQVIFREKDGRVNVFRDGTYVPKIMAPNGKDAWTWNAKTKQYEGTPLPSSPIQIYPDKMTKDQTTGYLTMRAELLYWELDNAIARKDTTRLQNIQKYAGFVKTFAQKQGLPANVVKLYDLESHIDAQAKLLKRLGDEFKALQKIKVDEERNLTWTRKAFEARAAVGFLQLLASGAIVNDSDDDASYALALSGLSDLTQAAARRQLDERFIKEAGNLYAEEKLTKINSLRKELAENQAKLTDRPKEVWSQLGVDKEIVQSLDTFAASLLQKKDPTAAIAVLAARAKHQDSKGFTSPLLSAWLNSLKAADEARKPKDIPDRVERADRMYKLGQATIAAAQLVPDDPVFLPDRLVILTAGAKLIHESIVYFYDPKTLHAWSEDWDARADYGVRALNVAKTPEGIVADADGAARSLRAVLLFQRGLYHDALDFGRKVEDLNGLEPKYLVNIAKFYSKTGSPKEAAEALTKAFKGGYRNVRQVETDPDLRGMWEHQQRTKGDLYRYREVPELDVFLDPSPVSVGKAFPSYSLEIKNKTVYPLVNVKVKMVGKFEQGLKALPVSTQDLTIDYLAPVGSQNDTFFWPDAFKSPGRHDQSVLTASMDRRPQGGRLIVGRVPVKASDRSFYRPYWYWYSPYWYY